MNYRHTPEMGEISGFAGGTYEETCQTMLEAGVKWLNEHPDAELTMRHIPNVTGFFEMGTPEGEELSDVVADATLTEDGRGDLRRDCTGAQMHHIMMRLMFIKAHGWEKYAEEVSKPDPEDDEDDGEPPAAA